MGCCNKRQDGKQKRWNHVLAGWSAALLFIVGTEAGHPDINSWEPSDAEYWGQGAVSQAPFPVPEMNAGDLTRENFDYLVREGRAFVVRDLAENCSHPMKSWSCSYFQHDTEFSKVEVKREYMNDSSLPSFVRLGELGKTKSSSLSSSPFYLGIKEAIYQSPEDLAADPLSSVTWSRKVLEKVQSHTIVPPFMDPENSEILNSTPEFWFSAGSKGGGAKAHVDTHTESTMSLQLSGRKRWRLAPIARRAVPHVMKLYTDGKIYERTEQMHWNILADVFLRPGDALFFGPGFIHQTDAEPGECAASVTWQFNVPLPTKLWQSFLPRFRWTPDLEHTWPILRELLFAHKRQGATAELLDLDGDGKANASERKQVLSLWTELERRAQGPEGASKLLRSADITAVEDQDLSGLPPKLQRAVRRWERDALLKDEALYAATQGRDEL